MMAKMATKRALNDVADFIDDNYVILTKMLDVSATIPHLIQDRALTSTDKENILAKDAQLDRAGVLLDLLKANGKCTTDQLIDVLRKTQQTGLIDGLNFTDHRKRQANIESRLNLKAPTKLEAAETMHHLIQLAWEEVDDSEELVGYMVEQSPAGKNRWKPAHQEPHVIHKGSKPQLDFETESYKKYDFRVKAVYHIEDQYVHSDPKLLPMVVAKLKGQPFPPRRLQVESCNCNDKPTCVTFKWIGPVEMDHDSNISYILEKSLYFNDNQSTGWECCVITPDRMYTLQDGLEVGNTYRFRVLAKNETNGRISEATEMDGAEIRIHVDLMESSRPHFKRIEQTDVPRALFNNPMIKLKGKEEGSVILVHTCNDQDSLIELWEMYEQQKVHQVLQELFVSEELRACGVSPEDLIITIDQEDFKAGQKHLSLTDPTKRGFRVLKVESAHSTGHKELPQIQESSVYFKPEQSRVYPEQEISDLATSTGQMTMEEDVSHRTRQPPEGMQMTPTYLEPEHLASSITTLDLYNSPPSSKVDMDFEDTTTSKVTEDHEDSSKYKRQLGQGDSALHKSNVDSADVFQKSVQKYYELKLSHFKPLIWNDNFTLNLSDIFTRLELIQTKTGKQRKELKSLDDLFKPNVIELSTAPRCILIEGEAGGGKTTFLSKEALDAVSQKTELGRRHDIVLLIRLREVREGKTIEEIVWDQCVDEATEGINIQSIIPILQKKESHVLFLLDGYDELRPEARAAGQAIPRLLSGKLHPNSMIVITSRPSAGVQQYTRPDCHVQIMDFSPNNVEKFVQTYYSITEQPELAPELITFLHQSQYVANLIHTPYFLMLVCILWEEEQEMVDTTITGLYDNLVLCLVRQYCKREGVDMPTEGLPTEVYESLLQLGKLALEALLRNETLIDITEVERGKVNWELLLKLGVVSLEISASKLHPRKQLNFSHMTMQEFLAGRYVAHALLNQDIVELLQLTSISKALELSNLLLFTCGFDLRAAQTVMEELSKLSSREFTHLRPEQFERSHVPIHRNVQKCCGVYKRFAKLCLNILNERKEPEVLQAFSQALPIVILDNSTNSREGAALKYYIQNVRSANLPDRLIVKIRGDDDSRDTVQYLQQCFTTAHPGLQLDLKLSGHFDSPDQTARLVSVLKNGPSLRALDMSDTELTPSSLQPLVQGFSHMPLLQELDLSENPDLDDAGMEVLQVGLFCVPHLAVLRLVKVGMTAVGMSSLAPYMHHLVGLREMDISHNNIGDTGLESLTAILAIFTAMQVLILTQMGISPTGMRTLVPALCQLTRLIKLDISYNAIGDPGLECLSAILHHLTAMKMLVLSCTRISDRGISSLIKALPHLVQLQVLDVGYNYIGDSGIVSLVQTLCQPSSSGMEQNPPGDKSLATAPHYNNTLQELNIGFNMGVTGAGLGRVAQLISALPALTKLDMSAYEYSPVYLSDTAAMALAEALPRLPALEQLDLQNISMEPAGFQAIVQAAEEHPTLETFNYSRDLDPEEANIAATISRAGIQKYLSFIESKVSHMWKDLAYFLDLDDSGIRNLASRNRDDRSRCMDLLMEWQKRQGNAATMDVLMRALIDAGLHRVVDGLKEKFPELSAKQEPKPHTATKKKAMGKAKGSGTKPVVLFITDEYGSSKVGVSTINRQAACLLTSKGAKVYSTVLYATQEDIGDADDDGVQLIFPTTFREDPRMPSLDWLTYDHQSRYPNLPSDVGFIIGHVDITSRAARLIQEQRLPDAKLVQVTHVKLEVTSQGYDEVISILEINSILDDLQHADVIFSVGPLMYDYYTHQTTQLKLQHHMFLPKPSDIFSKMQVDHIKTLVNTVLSVGRVQGMGRLKGNDLNAKAMGIVIEELPNTKWRARGARAEDFQESRHIIQANMERGKFNFTPLKYGTQKELSKDMQQADIVLMPSRAEPFGLVGLEAIAAGVPVLVSDKSGLARFLRSQDPEFERLIVDVVDDDDDEAAEILAMRIIKVLKNGRREFEAARRLKEKLLSSRYWEESHTKFLETFGL